MKQTSGDRERQTQNSGGRVPQELEHSNRGQAEALGASVCQTCDGTGWTHTATKGLTRCTEQTGLPHA